MTFRSIDKCKCINFSAYLERRRLIVRHILLRLRSGRWHNQCPHESVESDCRFALLSIDLYTNWNLGSREEHAAALELAKRQRRKMVAGSDQIAVGELLQTLGLYVQLLLKLFQFGDVPFLPFFIAQGFEFEFYEVAQAFDCV